MFFSLRRLLHSAAYFFASLATLSLFVVVLMLAEALIYAVTGRAASMWAMALAGLAAAVFFSPIVQRLQHLIDRALFHRQLDTLETIQQLGAGDLAELPQEYVEYALLERIAAICHRSTVVLDERDYEGKGAVFCYPASAPLPPAAAGIPCADYELVLPINYREGMAWLHLSPRLDGWATDHDEYQSLEHLARFAAMSLEHARLSHQQSQLARLDSISRITGQLHSHDMKNRLHDLAFLAHHLEAGKLEKSDLITLVGSIRKVVGRMQTVMQRMSDPNAPIHPKLKVCDITSLLRQHVDDRLWPESVHVNIDLPALPPVLADALLLQGVFENLFDNAVQAMNKQGKLDISAQVKGDYLQVDVRDYGNGMSTYFIEHRLFQMFSTSKDDGLGIGLYLSQRIMHAHGGKISANSDGEGKGCIFHVTLPLCKDVPKAETGGQ
ncbi:MAG: ATP-binding protein [Mariprofundaceae bacterium]|nr:ATP-binding protein [Mariprofundaceae bacterium]